MAGCFYFSGLCYAALTNCADATIPNTATTDTLKSLFCHSMKKTGGDYCKLNAAKDDCADNADTDCTSFDKTSVTSG